MNPTNGTPAPAPAPPGHPAEPATPLPSPSPSLRSNDPTLLAQALRHAQENLVALQKLSEQTANLHRQYLDGQDKAQRTFQTLLEQQQRLTFASLGLADLAAPPPPAPHPRVQLPPAREMMAVEPAAPRFVAPAPPAPEPRRESVVTTPPPSAPAASSLHRIEAILLEVVSEKTGYPANMLEPGMQLDADLGIDSIKRVEILSALQERLPEAPAVKPEHLGTLRTLGQIVEFLAHENVGSAVRTMPETGQPKTQDPGRSAQQTVREIQAILLEVVADKTGYPADMLEPGMQLDADLGIDSIKRVEILSALQECLPDAPAVKPEHLGTLRTLGQIVEFLAHENVGSAVRTTLEPGRSTQRTLHEIQAILLEVVADKTGYPADMLEPDMQLDADLGIDSIKRVEILSALQERLPDAPMVKPEHLGTLRTLGQIVEFLASPGNPTSVGPAVPAESPNAAGTAGPTGSHPENGNGWSGQSLHAPVGNTKNSAPATHQEDLLRASEASRPAVQRLVVTSAPLRDLDHREAVAIRAGGTFWITDDGLGVARALARHFEKAGYKPHVVTRSELGVLTPPERLDGLVLLAPTSDDAITGAFRLLRACGPALRSAGQGTGSVFATVSRLDGAFGFRGLGHTADSTSGGLAGLSKTASHEWPEVACKAIDLDPEVDPESAAALLFDEILRRGPVEVGLAPGGRTTLRLDPVPLDGAEGEAPLRAGDVVAITGGARGVTAEVAVALAEAFRPTIVLLGRSPEPSREPDWLAPLSDEGEIKRALIARANGHATPQIIGAQFRDLSANREILETLRRIEEAGARAIYRSVDVRDRASLKAKLDAVRAEVGPIRGLIHGAGVLADRRIEDQTDDQFAAVYDTKVEGLRGLLDATAADDLRILVLFSSSTARFGRKGQVAYAAANEVLNKWACREAQARPSCRVVSVNWGPWDGGMVTPSLKPLFASEGVPLIPTRDGARYLVEELCQRDERPVEVVILGAKEGKAAPSVTMNPTLETIFERTLDVATTPVLRSHVIDGHPVLPMALILEWLAEGALQRNPGLAFCGVDGLRLFKGIVLRDERPEVVRILAGKPVREGAQYRVPVELRGYLGEDREFLHARGEVVLADRHPQGHRTIEERELPPLGQGMAEVYRDVLFHGPDLHGIDRIEGCDASGIAAVASTAPEPSAWVDRPLRKAWLSDPLALDCAFQLLVIWSAEHLGAGSLPTVVGHYRQFRRAFPATEVRILAKITQTSAHRARANIEILDLDGSLIAQMNDYECVVDASLNQAFRRNRMTLATQ